MEITCKELGNYLKDLRVKNELSTREVYNLCGVSNSYLSLVENGKRKASAIVLKKLATVYRVSYLDLYEKAGYADLVKNETIGDEVVQIPVYGKISAGKPIEMIENIIDHVFISAEQALKGSYFGLEVSGDSMDRIIPNGSRVIVKKQETLENGEIGVITVNGYDATVKRYEQEYDMVYLYPESNNPEHKVQRYSLKETSISILGKVESYNKKL